MRWVKWLSIGLAALVVLALAAVGIRTLTLPGDDLDTVEPGRLDVAAAAVGSWQVGGIQVDLDAEGLRLREDGRTLWSAPAGTAFLTAGRGNVAWTEETGYFWPSVGYAERLPDQSVDAVEVADDVLVLRGELGGDDGSVGYRATVTPRPAGGAVLEIVADDEVDSLKLISERSDGAGVHGFGEQFDDFDLSGRLLPIVAREQGVGRGTQPLTFLADLTNGGAGGTRDMTYAAWSSFVTGDLRGVRLDPALTASHAFAVADTRDPRQVGLEVWAPTLRAELTSADSPATLVSAQHADPVVPLAPWTQSGAIVGLQGGTEVVRDKLDRLRAADTAISAVWLQDWTGQRTTSFGERLWWTWQLDRDRYPGWDDLVAELAEDGIRTTTYVNPWLVDADPKGDSTIRNLWAEARDAGHLVLDPGGAVYEVDQGGFSAALVDLTDPAARAWFAEVIAEQVLGAGVDGFMADFGEGLPFDADLASGSPLERHNQWPLLWAQTVREACELAEKPDCVTWFRAGALGQAAYSPLFWNGDQLVTFDADDGLASALLGSFSAGVSGWPLVHSDVGGYTSIDAVVRDYVRGDDLLARWSEYAAFGPVMRTHEGNRPAANAQVYDTDEVERFAAMTRLFAALAPYRREVLAEAVTERLPAVRHGWLVVPGTRAAEVDTQFFLGDAVLVAPVLAAGADEVEVTFPPGTWVHLLTGAEYAGDTVAAVAAPLGTPAAFVRADDPRAAQLRRDVS